MRPPTHYPPRPALVTGKVMVVGDPIALVVAETYFQARDAAEAIEIEYEPLPVNVVASKANKPGAPVLREDCPSNESFFYTAGDKEAVEAAIASAAHVTQYHTVINRITANTMAGEGEAKLRTKKDLFAQLKLPQGFTEGKIL